MPVNYLANPGIDARLKSHFACKADDDEKLRQALGVDFRSVGARYVGPKLHADVPDRTVDPIWGYRTRYVKHATGGYWEWCDFPLLDADELAVAAWPMASPDNYDYSGVLEECRRYKGYAISPAGYLGDIICGNGFLRGMEQTFVDLIAEEPAGMLLADRRMSIQLETTRRILEAARGQVDFLWLGEDLGTQRAPLISLDVFRKQIRPRFQKFCDLAKAYNCAVMIHSCGSSSWAYEDFIEMGINVVDTLQPEAKDMAPAILKKRFGGRLAFHGCISTAGPLAFGTAEEVIKYCRNTLEIMMPGGGYTFAPTHLIQDNSPTENVLAMYETGRKYGKYA